MIKFLQENEAVRRIAIVIDHYKGRFHWSERDFFWRHPQRDEIGYLRSISRPNGTLFGENVVEIFDLKGPTTSRSFWQRRQQIFKEETALRTRGVQINKNMEIGYPRMFLRDLARFRARNPYPTSPRVRRHP